MIHWIPNICISSWQISITAELIDQQLLAEIDVTSKKEVSKNISYVEYTEFMKT